MIELNQLELGCLEKVASGSYRITVPCAVHILNRLLSLGLIEQGPRICLPLEMTHNEYRLTPSGISALKRQRTQE